MQTRNKKWEEEKTRSCLAKKLQEAAACQHLHFFPAQLIDPPHTLYTVLHYQSTDCLGALILARINFVHVGLIQLDPLLQSTSSNFHYRGHLSVHRLKEKISYIHAFELQEDKPSHQLGVATGPGLGGK